MNAILADLSLWLLWSLSIKFHPKEMKKIIAKYIKVVDQLDQHVHHDNMFPAPRDLLSKSQVGSWWVIKLLSSFHIPTGSGVWASGSEQIFEGGSQTVISMSFYNSPITRERTLFGDRRVMFSIPDQDIVDTVA